MKNQQVQVDKKLGHFNLLLFPILILFKEDIVLP